MGIEISFFTYKGSSINDVKALKRGSQEFCDDITKNFSVVTINSTWGLQLDIFGQKCS